MNKTDLSLLKKIKLGDRPAFMLLYERYWEILYKMIFIRVKDKDVTEELLQNLWIKIIENPDSIQTDQYGSAKGYLLKHLHYRIIDFYATIKKSQNIIGISDEVENVIPEISDNNYNEILEENDVQQLFEMINEVVSQLSSTDQKVYEMRIQNNKSVDETADILGLSKKTVSNSLSKTLSEIREQLDPKYQSSKNLVSFLVLAEMLQNFN